MGRSKHSRQCPRCASKDVILQDSYEDGIDLFICADCDHEFEVGGYHSKKYDKYSDEDDYEQEYSNND
ncbi:MAG: hypothetical protein ABIE07_08660 [Candidatus Zixiibacteriota bacterium]